MTVRIVPWKPDAKGPKRWRVDVRFKKPDGTKVRNQSVYEAPTEGMARRWGQARESQLRAGSLVVTKATRKTFAAFVEDDWLPTYPKAAGNKHTTVKSTKSHVSVHLTPFFGAMRLDEIDRMQIDQFVAEMSEKTVGKEPAARTSRNGRLPGPRPLSAKRIKNVVGTLHKILTTAVQWDALDKLPEFPKIKTSEGAFDFYNVTEAALLVDAASDAEEQALLRFSLHTGARAGESLALEWTDVDRRSRLVSFSKSRTDGVTTDSTKSGKPRKVPLSETVLADLKAIKHLKGPLVFCQSDGEPLTLWHLHGILERASRRAGVRLLRWHDLRHSFASNLTIGGAPIRQVQEWMGHATITMTMRYAHLAPNGGREYLAALEAPTVSPRDAAAE